MDSSIVIIEIKLKMFLNDFIDMPKIVFIKISFPIKPVD